MKIRIALFFSVLFISILIIPTVILVTDPSQEISFFLDFNEEEEENKGKEESKTDSELKINTSTYAKPFLSNHFTVLKNIHFYSKMYVSEYPKITTPPPRFIA